MEPSVVLESARMGLISGQGPLKWMEFGEFRLRGIRLENGRQECSRNCAMLSRFFFRSQKGSTC